MATDRVEIDIELKLRGKLAAAIVSAAKARSIEPADLIANILEIVVGDNLIDAVVDDA